MSFIAAWIVLSGFWVSLLLTVEALIDADRHPVDEFAHDDDAVEKLVESLELDRRWRRWRR